MTTDMKNTERKSGGVPEMLSVTRWLLGVGLFLSIIALPFSVATRPLIWSPLIALAVVTFIRFGKTSVAALSAMSPWLWVLLAYIAVSALWSSDPLLSGKRAILELGVAMLCVSLIIPGYASSWFPSVLRPIMTLILILSIVAVVAFPGYGTDNGAWRGILPQKNNLGEVAILCVVLWAVKLPGDSSRMIWRVLAAALSIVVIVFANNATAIVVLIAVLGLLLLTRTYKGGWVPVWFIVAIVVLLVSHILGVAFGYPTPMEMVSWGTGLLGREPNLTGRTDLWVYIWNEAIKHPWFGGGYGAFWVGSAGDTAAEFAWASQGHNVYVDIFNQLGIIGLILVALLFLSHGSRLLALSRLRPDIAHLHVILFFCILIFGTTDTLLFRGPAIGTVILWVSHAEVSCLLSAYQGTNGRPAYSRYTGSLM